MTQPIRAGQIWYHSRITHQWKIKSIEQGEVIAYCGYPKQGEVVWEQLSSGIGQVDERGHLPGFDRSGWKVIGNINQLFSKINLKTLRKRMRDQLAQKLLTGKP